MQILASGDAGTLAPPPRREQVLELVARRRSIKQIANALDISESTVNYHIRSLKEEHRVNTLAQLADIFTSDWDPDRQPSHRFSASSESAVSNESNFQSETASDDREPLIRFQDAISYGIDAPWIVNEDLAVVPRVLEGTNAGLIRGAIIVFIALGMLATILVGLGVAQGITAALNGVSTSPGSAT